MRIFTSREMEEMYFSLCLSPSTTKIPLSSLENKLSKILKSRKKIAQRTQRRKESYGGDFQGFFPSYIPDLELKKPDG